MPESRTVMPETVWTTRPREYLVAADRAVGEDARAILRDGELPADRRAQVAINLILAHVVATWPIYLAAQDDQ
jgi:hypothetical protein